MFLHLSVILSTGGSAPVHPGIHHLPEQNPLPGADNPLGADTPSGADTLQEQTSPREQTATAADGTHPTGMHSCC